MAQRNSVGVARSAVMSDVRRLSGIGSLSTGRRDTPRSGPLSQCRTECDTEILEFWIAAVVSQVLQAVGMLAHCGPALNSLGGLNSAGIRPPEPGGKPRRAGGEDGQDAC